jgi:ABC-2 type transport system ATP-binding protein
MNTVVSFDDVGKRYANGVALEYHTFDVPALSFAALIGNNGCGKTTTLNILCNLVSYDSGKVEVFGERLTPRYVSYKKRMGIFLSTDYLIPALTIEEYLQFVCKFQGVPRSEADRRIKDAVEFFELGQHARKQIKDLSAGTKVKVGLSGAMVHNPELLVLDEPFANLDILSVSKLSELLLTLKGKKTLIITSHALEPVANLCDQYLVMDKGRVGHAVSREEFDSSDALVQSIRSMLTVKNNSSNLDWLK